MAVSGESADRQIAVPIVGVWRLCGHGQITWLPCGWPRRSGGYNFKICCGFQIAGRIWRSFFSMQNDPRVAFWMNQSQSYSYAPGGSSLKLWILVSGIIIALYHSKNRWSCTIT
jgi:hypothetical protein